MSSKWPYNVTTQYVIDGYAQVLDLRDYTLPDRGAGEGTVTSSIVASYIGESMQLHTIDVRVSEGGKFAVLDRFMYVSPALQKRR